MESLRRAPAEARLGLTAEPGSALRAVVDAVIDLSVSEDSAVRVIGYTTSVQGLVLIAEALAGTGLPAQRPDNLLDQVEGCIQAAERAAEEFLGDERVPCQRRLRRHRVPRRYRCAGRSVSARGLSAPRRRVRHLSVPSRANRGGANRARHL